MLVLIGFAALLAVVLVPPAAAAAGIYLLLEGTVGDSAAAPKAAPKMPDAAVAGCDVLLKAPVNHHCLLPWPNDAFTVRAGTTTGRRINVARKIAPANNKGVRVNTAAHDTSAIAASLCRGDLPPSIVQSLAYQTTSATKGTSLMV